MSKKMIYLISFVLVLSLAGKGWSYTSMPTPADGALHEDTWAILSWVPGPNAVSYDIYLGENYDDVKQGTGGTFQGNQSKLVFVIGFPGFPYPNGLIPGTTYYWRIDEVDNQGNTTTGDVWTFTTISGPPPKGSIRIVRITKRSTPYVGKVYNLKVEGSDRYLVGKDAVIVRDY